MYIHSFSSTLHSTIHNSIETMLHTQNNYAENLAIYCNSLLILIAAASHNCGLLHQNTTCINIVSNCITTACIQKQFLLYHQTRSAPLTGKKKHIDLLSKGLTSTRHKTGHFGDVLPSQSLGTVLQKLNLTQQKHTYTKYNKK